MLSPRPASQASTLAQSPTRTQFYANRTGNTNIEHARLYSQSASNRPTAFSDRHSIRLENSTSQSLSFDSNSNRQWAPHLHIDALAQLTGDNVPEYNPSALQHGAESLAHQHSDGGDGWNGKHTPGLFNLYEPSTPTTLNAMMAAGDTARARRGYDRCPPIQHSPRLTMTENYGLSCNTGPAVSQIRPTRPTASETHEPDLLSKCKKKAKELFGRAFRQH